jgi:RNA polymerase sigma-70 factor (ECF subfamily)
MIFKRKEYSEEEIIAGCINNNRKHQELLYRRYFPKMIRMCYRFTQDEDRAMQIVNDGFLRVFKKLEKYSSKGSFEGWIRKIVYHSISDHFRKESRYLKFIVLDGPEKETQSTALDDLYYDDLISLLDQIPPKSSLVFRLYAIEGYSHQEIAGQLNISDGTSKWHLSNARIHLKSILESRTKTNYAG